MVERLRIAKDSLSWSVLGEISGEKEVYPLVKIVLGKGNPRRALISAGIHGDEPAGVEAVSEFIENRLYTKFIHDWEITFLPCLNPWGYEYDCRQNHEGKDLNREFKSSSSPLEVKLIQSVLNNPFDLSLELHEDDESSGFYLYGKGDSGKEEELGQKILRGVEDILPVNMGPVIEGSKAINGVVLKGCGSKSEDWWPMAVYTKSHGTGACFTLETSQSFPMRVRISAHLRAIETALVSM